MKRPSYKPVTRAHVTVHGISFPREHLESEAASHTRHFHHPGLDSSGLPQDLLGNLFLPSVLQPSPSCAQLIWADWLWVSWVGCVAEKVWWRRTKWQQHLMILLDKKDTPENQIWGFLEPWVSQRVPGHHHFRSVYLTFVKNLFSYDVCNFTSIYY